jgi:hypothetical protein
VASEDTELMVGDIGATGFERGIGMSSSSSRPESAEEVHDAGRDDLADSARDASGTSTLESLLKRSSSLSSPSAYKGSFFGEAGSALAAAARLTGTGTARAETARALEVRHSLLTTTSAFTAVFGAFRGAVAG